MVVVATMLLNVILVAQHDSKRSELLLGQYGVLAGLQQDCVVGDQGISSVRTTFSYLLAGPGYSETPGQGKLYTEPVLKTTTTHGSASTYPHPSVPSQHESMAEPPVAAVNTALATATGLTNQDLTDLDKIKGRIEQTRHVRSDTRFLGNVDNDSKGDVQARKNGVVAWINGETPPSLTGDNLITKPKVRKPRTAKPWISKKDKEKNAVALQFGNFFSQYATPFELHGVLEDGGKDATIQISTLGLYWYNPNVSCA